MWLFTTAAVPGHAVKQLIDSIDVGRQVREVGDIREVSVRTSWLDGITRLRRMMVFCIRWMEPLDTKFARLAMVSSNCGGDVVWASGMRVTRFQGRRLRGARCRRAASLGRSRAT